MHSAFLPSDRPPAPAPLNIDPYRRRIFAAATRPRYRVGGAFNDDGRSYQRRRGELQKFYSVVLAVALKPRQKIAHEQHTGYVERILSGERGGDGGGGGGEGVGWRHWRLSAIMLALLLLGALLKNALRRIDVGIGTRSMRELRELATHPPLLPAWPRVHHSDVTSPD